MRQVLVSFSPGASPPHREMSKVDMGKPLADQRVTPIVEAPAPDPSGTLLTTDVFDDEGDGVTRVQIVHTGFGDAEAWERALESWRLGTVRGGVSPVARLSVRVHPPRRCARTRL